MSTAAFLEIPNEWTVADLQHYLDGIPLERIRLRPWPGTATVQDVVALDDHHDRLCELIDGIVVEKAMGFEESWIASNLVFLIRQFLQENALGIVTGADGMIQLLPNQVRIPDVAFFSWDRLPERKLPREPVPHLVPDLVIEVLSTNNTPTEMQRKLREYFQAGVRLVWYVDPKSRTVSVHTSVNDSSELDEHATLSGGTVLPGFELPARVLFELPDQPR